jgi:hypothetical protein
LHRGFLTIEIGAKVESAVGGIDIHETRMAFCCRREGRLIGEIIEIARPVGPVGDEDLGIGLEKGL